MRYGRSRAMQFVTTGDGSIIRPFAKHRSEREIRAALPDLWPRLWRYAMVLTRDRMAADDLAQAACLRAIEKASHYEAGTRVDAWVMRILHRLWLNDLRRDRTQNGINTVQIDDTELSDPKCDTETNIFHTEVLSKVMALPDAQRETVLLAYFEGYKYKEVAEMLDIPIGTVMSRLAAARAKLTADLGEG